MDGDHPFLDNIQQRYPEAPREVIAAALKEADGHGGMAESILLKSNADWLKRQRKRELAQRIESLKKERVELKEKLARDFDYQFSVPCARPSACQQC